LVYVAEFSGSPAYFKDSTQKFRWRRIALSSYCVVVARSSRGRRAVVAAVDAAGDYARSGRLQLSSPPFPNKTSRNTTKASVVWLIGG
jgi:hypothetical protein